MIPARARAFQRFEHIRTAIGCAHIALVLLGDDTDGLTVVTASSEPHDITSSPDLGSPTSSYAKLLSGRFSQITDAKGTSGAHPYRQPRYGQADSLDHAAAADPERCRRWHGALVLTKPSPQTLHRHRHPRWRRRLNSWRRRLRSSPLAVRSRHLMSPLRERTRRVRITHLSPPPQKRPLLQYRGVSSPAPTARHRL